MDSTPHVCSNNTGSFNYTVTNYNTIIADEYPDIMRWLSPLDPRRRHHDVRTDRQDDVGNWFLETSQLLKWRSNECGADNAVLFCCGNPGVGKTYLSSLVVDDLLDGPCEEGTAVAMFYCDFRDQHELTAANIMGAILKQLVVRDEVLGHVQAAFEKAKTEVGGRGPRLPDMVRMLKQVVSILPQVFICVDALDECPFKNLLELLASMKDILEESPRTRIFVTGRPQVEAQITKYFGTGLVVQISPDPHDIIRYLEEKLMMDPNPEAMSNDLRAEILKVIPERISEIFLLVSLTIDAILEGVTVSERRQKLKEMTKGNHLSDAYAATLARMRAQNGGGPRLGIAALMWVMNSERPLQSSELCHALGVKIGSADLDLEDVPEIGTILRCSLGLITESSSTVRLVHFTLREYLSEHLSLFQSPHLMIAEVCLTYLNFRRVRQLSPTDVLAPFTFPLLRYASHYWGKHIRREKTESLTPLALRLLDRFEEHISSQLLLLHCRENIPWWELGFYRGSSLRGFTGLHGAAFLGIVDVVAALLATKEWDINAKDTNGRTALSWAAVGGHGGVVEILLRQKDVNPDAADAEYGRTPLWWAAKGGHEEVLMLLLERGDINRSAADTECGRAPLGLGGHERVVKLLLERADINPNTTDTFSDRTPLSWAAESGHEGVVKLLLGRKDINPNAADTLYDRTPLSWAAESGHEGVVKLLLERCDVNPSAPNRIGETAIELAVSRGHTGVVELLSEPRPLPVPASVGNGPENPSPGPLSLPQTPRPIRPPSPSLPNPVPPNTKLLFGIAILSFMTIPISILLLCYLYYLVETHNVPLAE